MYKTGDRIEIDCEDRTVEGWVELASSNGVSLLIQFHTVLHGHVGRMPVLMSDDTHGHSIVDGTPVVIRPRED